MAAAIAREAALRAGELNGKKVETLYFGGGTPSLMTAGQLRTVTESIRKHYPLASDLEFTFEANPDDLKPAKTEELRALGANRLSIGLQSFDDRTLQWMNRAHSAAESLTCVKTAKARGFDNISIDLIYGLPGLDDRKWREELKKAVDLDVQHISAYCLTVEEKTVLGNRVRKGLEKPVDEDAAARQFEVLTAVLRAAGFAHYEVSNFAKPGMRSRHNSAYWEGVPYLGLGPSAHSFDGHTRSWNLNKNTPYIRALERSERPYTAEVLSTADRHNEWVMTGLRLERGIDTRSAAQAFGTDFEAVHRKTIENLTAKGLAEYKDGRLRLTDAGRFMADGIAAEFFILEP